ncbi:hypothetical protein [Chlamydiifrater phoenicopteri]|uniref:hypothetical protein n=1 Tax=Chlamydiifrater phoenicopteri TaxID=2681469 RepID=UPI001BCC1631|nr:hypothetical protein [Chlamydiifrater phoenicopteri]
MRILQKKTGVIFCIIALFVLFSGGMFAAKVLRSRPEVMGRSDVCFKGQKNFLGPEMQESEIIQPLFLTSSDMSRV